MNMHLDWMSVASSDLAIGWLVRWLVSQSVSQSVGRLVGSLHDPLSRILGYYSSTL